MTSKHGWVGSVLLQKGGQIDVRMQNGAKRDGTVHLSIRILASELPKQVTLVASEVDELIKVLQKARA
jgi:hypothetical protein